MYSVCAQQDIRIRAPAAQVFAVLTDYEKYPQLFDAVRSVKLHTRDEGVSSATFVVDVLVHIECTVRLVEDQPSSLRFSRTDANLLQHMSGAWTLTQDDTVAACALGFAIEVKLAGQIPKAVEQRLIGQRLPAMLDGVRRYVEAQSASP